MNDSTEIDTETASCETTHYKRISIQELINDEPMQGPRGIHNTNLAPTKAYSSLSPRSLESQGQAAKQSGSSPFVPTFNPETSIAPAMHNSATQSLSSSNSNLRPLAPQPSFAGLNIIAAAARRCCAKCGRSDSPSWCRLPEGFQLLCNTCCVCQQDKSEIKRQKSYKSWLEGLANTRPPAHPESMEKQNIKVTEHQCVRCKTPNSPTWRKRIDGDLLCYACALSEESHIPYRPKIVKVPQAPYIPIEYNSFNRSAGQIGLDAHINHRPDPFQ